MQSPSKDCEVFINRIMCIEVGRCILKKGEARIEVESYFFPVKSYDSAYVSTDGCGWLR